MTTTVSSEPSTATSPPHAGITLVALILVATVANLNLSVANVALPDIGLAFNAWEVFGRGNKAISEDEIQREIDRQR